MDQKPVMWSTERFVSAHIVDWRIPTVLARFSRQLVPGVSQTISEL